MATLITNIHGIGVMNGADITLCLQLNKYNVSKFLGFFFPILWKTEFLNWKTEFL